MYMNDNGHSLKPYFCAVKKSSCSLYEDTRDSVAYLQIVLCPTMHFIVNRHLVSRSLAHAYTETHAHTHAYLLIEERWSDLHNHVSFYYACYTCLLQCGSALWNLQKHFTERLFAQSAFCLFFQWKESKLCCSLCHLLFVCLNVVSTQVSMCLDFSMFTL